MVYFQWMMFLLPIFFVFVYCIECWADGKWIGQFYQLFCSNESFFFFVNEWNILTIFFSSLSCFWAVYGQMCICVYTDWWICKKILCMSEYILKHAQRGITLHFVSIRKIFWFYHYKIVTIQYFNKYVECNSDFKCLTFKDDTKYRKWNNSIKFYFRKLFYENFSKLN